MGHNTEKSTLARVWKTEDLAHSGREWHSPAFDLFDNQHPAVTGHHHPAAVKGAATGHSLTSQMQEGTGQLDRLKAEHGKTEGERIANQTGQVHGAAETGTKGVRAEGMHPEHGHGSHHGQGGNVSGLPSSTYGHGQQQGYNTGSVQQQGYNTGSVQQQAYQTGVADGAAQGYSTGATGTSGLRHTSQQAGVFDPATGTYSAPGHSGRAL